MYQLFACGCPAGHSLPTTGLADPVNLSFDMQKTGTSIFTRVRGRKRHQHSECLFCQYQDTKIRIYFAFLLERIDFQLGGEEVPKTAMSELNWIHEFFYNKWDFPKCYWDHQLLDSAWKDVGSGCRRLAAFHTRSSHRMKNMATADFSNFSTKPGAEKCPPRLSLLGRRNLPTFLTHSNRKISFFYVASFSLAIKMPSPFLYRVISSVSAIYTSVKQASV